MATKRDPARAKQLRERARDSEVRATMLDVLGDGGELSPRELQRQMPNGTSLSVVAYHLEVLANAELVDCVGGLYRLA